MHNYNYMYMYIYIYIYISSPAGLAGHVHRGDRQELRATQSSGHPIWQSFHFFLPSDF